jgi:hypothetical protein
VEKLAVTCVEKQISTGTESKIIDFVTPKVRYHILTSLNVTEIVNKIFLKSWCIKGYKIEKYTHLNCMIYNTLANIQ